MQDWIKKKREKKDGKLGCDCEQQGDHGKIKVTVPGIECCEEEEGGRRRRVETRGKPIFGEWDHPSCT